MKGLPVLLLNVATVAIALVAYDQFRSTPAPVAAPAETGGEARAPRSTEPVAATPERRPSRRAGRPDPQILARLEALEHALATLPDGSGAQAASADGRHPAEAAAAGQTDRSDAPTAAEIRRFKRIRKAVRLEEAVAKNRKRIDAALDTLPIALTEKQREKVHAAYAAFRPRVGEIWTEVKVAARETVAAGGTIDRETIIVETTETIQQEFAAALAGVVPAGDATTVSEALLADGK